MNSRLCALLAGLVLLAGPGIHAQTPAASAPAAIRGDVDGDGRVTRADAEAVRAYLVRGTLPGGRSILPAGDANGDGRVTSADAVLISRFAAGVDVSRFPVGRAVEPSGGGGRVGSAFLSPEYECTVDVAAGTTSCEVAGPKGSAGGARLDVSLGSGPISTSGSFVHSRGNSANEDTSTATVSITNKAVQPIGTTDGTNPAPNGNRLYYTTLPYVRAVSSGTVAGATVRVDNPEGIADFSATNMATTWDDRPYFQYNGILVNNATSGSKQIRYVYSSNVTSFTYSYRVMATVQFEYGWITLSPGTTPVLAPGDTAKLTGASFNYDGQSLTEPITWSSSDPAVATVDGSGKVTAVDEGTATITAAADANAQRKGTRVVTVDKFPSVTSTTPTNGATGVLVTDNIVINFSEAVNVTGSAFTLECPAGSSQAFTVSGNGTSAITLNPDADLPAAVTCTVNVDGNEVTDVDTNDGPNMMAGNYSFSFETAIQAVSDAFGTTTTGNVRINSASTSPAFSVTTNDKITASTTITFAGWSGVAGKTLGGGDVVMTTSGTDMGKFTYNPPAGFEGTDSLEYTITSGSVSASAKVALPVSGMIWFVNNGGAACTTRASGCGRLTNPYSTLAAFNAENNGTGNNPAAGDAVFLYESASAYTGPVTLLADQKLIGQDAGAGLSDISGITPATGSDPLPSMNPGANTVTVAGASGGVVLAADNLLRGFSLATTGGTALSGTGFGTPTIAEVPISATGGAALSLDNGTLNSTFPSVSSTNSTGRGISLTNVNGSPTFTAGSISGAAQAAFLVSGGNVGFTWPGTIGQANNAPLVDVQGSHTGTLTFSGTLTATNGTGLQFNAAQGTYTFSGTTTLNGGDAGVDITNGSTGTFNFNATTAITNPTGTGLNVYGSAPALVSYAGSITKNGTSTGRLVEIGEMTGGTVTFAVGSTLSSTSTAPTATGISLSNADGTVNFNGTTTLNGGDAGVDVLSGTGGTIVFGANTSITNPSGTALNVNGSTPNLTYNGNITKNGTSAGLLVDIGGQSGGGTLAANGTITFQTGTLTSTSSASTGIQLSDVDGTVNFNGTTTLSSGNNGVDVIGGSTGSISFASGTSITNPSGPALFVDASAPSLTFAGPISTNAASGRPVHIEDLTGGSITVSGSITSSGPGLGILVQNNTSGAPSISFTGTRSLTTGTNPAVTLDNNDAATLNFGTAAMSIGTTSGAGFRAVNGGTVNVTGASNTVSTGTGTAVTVENTSIGGSGLTFLSVTQNGGVNGILLTSTGTAGGLTVTGSGSAAASGGTIQNTSGTAVQATNAASVNLNLMSIQPDASGVLLTNVSGSSSLNRSVVDYLGTAPGGAFAFRLANTSTNATVTLDGTTFEDKMDGTTSVSISAMGNSVITFNAIDSNTGDAFPSRYQNLFGSGIVVGAGDDVGSTAMVTANISNTSFLNAPSNGLNNLELGVTQNATLVPNITNNTFDKVALPLATVGVINLNATVMGRVGSNAAPGVISSNTITNIRSGAGPTFAYDPAGTNGYVGMRIAIENDAGGVNHKLQIVNNSLTQIARQGMLISARGAANNVNVRVQGNTIGTLAAPVGTASARRGVEIEAQTTATLKIEVVNNPSIVGGTSASNSALHLRAGVNAGATSTVNATVTGNTIANPNAGTNDGRFRAETVSGNNGTMCLDLRNNVLESASKEFQTNNNGGTYNRNASGNTGTITAIGAIGAVASCPTPSF